MGPLVETSMNRCIHCTRCVRFATEVAGVPELGAVGRGEDMEITTYLEKALTSELSGNVVDLCPVGALTSKPYAFTSRPWELRKTESIDVLDAVGTNIRVDSRGREVMRVLPRVNEDVNEEWLADKSRHACDGLRFQRLDRPYVRVGGKLKPATWNEAFDAIAGALVGVSGDKIAAIAGDLADVEAMFALKSLMHAMGSRNIDCRQDGAALDPSVRASYLFNSTIAGIEQADSLLIIGANPRKEAPILNARIRKRQLKGNFMIGLIGDPVDLTYPYRHIGTTADLIAGRKKPEGSKNGMIILGMGALARPDGAAILAAVRKLAEENNAVTGDWNGFNVLHTAAGRVGGLDVGFVPGQGARDVRGILDGASKGEINFVYLLGADEIDTAKLGKAFVVYQGHHGDRGAHRADVILPGAAYTEKDATYVNTEGRVQRANRAVFPPGDAREDWTIVRALSAVLGHTLPFDSLLQLRQQLNVAHPLFAGVDTIQKAAWKPFGTEGQIAATPLRSPVENYYMTDPISRNSPTMAMCTEEFVHGRPAPTTLQKTGTHG
jgi:NADH-quinone oxidoreductase subunit G